MLRILTRLNIPKSSLVSNQRSISTSYRLNDIFKIQSEKDFEERVIKSKTPVVVDFFATWCMPCKMLTPRIEAVIDEHKGKVSLAKVDIDELTDLSLEYDVQSVPVLAVVKNGKVTNKMIGLQDTDKLRQWVSENIKN
ncbi:CLUMA_CG016391, isoform A [Clunio marinus]|uniref:CLUMA_CG016391, isoform A n=1 Tax=Clunio marinus TaxID=568069 RepID=A0A1J1ISX0_9DIPT|nr:CLUMA_CG016391, isoform A [Clunio marinus]